MHDCTIDDMLSSVALFELITALYITTVESNDNDSTKKDIATENLFLLSESIDRLLLCDETITNTIFLLTPLISDQFLLLKNEFEIIHKPMGVQKLMANEFLDKVKNAIDFIRTERRSRKMNIS